jgi:hypothetical protein
MRRNRRLSRFLAPGIIGVLAGLLYLVPPVSSVPQPSTPKGDKATQEGIDFFERKIRPVLVQHCYSCHSSDSKKKLKGGLSVETRQGLLDGGVLGPAIVPGHPEKSLLIKAIRHVDPDLKMPRKEKLPDEIIADFEKWVKLGAPDPRTGTAKAAHKYPTIEDGRRRCRPCQRLLTPAGRATTSTASCWRSSKKRT